MKYFTLFIISFFLCSNNNLWAQNKKSKDTPRVKSEQPLPPPSSPLKDIRSIPNADKTILQSPLNQFSTNFQLQRTSSEARFLKIKTDPSTGLPNWIEGKLNNAAEQRGNSVEVRCMDYLEAVKTSLQIENPAEEFFIQKTTTDVSGKQHLRMQQQFQGLPVFGSELIAHFDGEDIYLVNGQYYPTPTEINIVPTIQLQNVKQIVRSDISTFSTFQNISEAERKYVAGEQFESELVVYHPERKVRNPKLAYHLTVIPNLTERWEYLVDAHTGEVLHHYSSVCKFHVHLENHEMHALPKKTENISPTENKFSTKKEKTTENAMVLNGPATANATDLQGISRTINTYEVNGTYFMYDGSRPMFDSSSDLPSDPKGMIVTVDGLGTYPNNNDFDYSVITSSNNTWNNPSAVSTHYNGGEAYQYFKTTHLRESINGQGGTIISFFNISDEDGSDMDNAFWNGAAMFYGNGNQAFNFPLQRALDVAGHEMSHGVIQGTANLEYQGQSGALNESFADIFGAMIDRDDWQMGENITNPNYIASGALRSLSDPNNGGSSLNNAGWQPKTMAEYQNLPNTPQGDNGGVHINSGIPNYAYYLFATEIGKDKAELIYFKALDDYLVKSSQFVDLRNAVVQAAGDLYGNAEVNAANAAFDMVQIGEGTGGSYQNDVSVNDGDDRILHSNANLDALYISDVAGNFVVTPQLSLSNPFSKPSVTDDGRVIVFVDDEHNIKVIDIDWVTGTLVEDYLEQTPSSNWDNIAISKDGTRVAAVRTVAENKIWVYDFTLGGNWQIFDLYNPTTADPNTGSTVTTGEVQYADAMEFDFSGEYILYDAFNKVESSLGNSEVEYWDIGFLKVFDNTTNNFATGTIEKLFTGLPSGVSIGNPTFSKNSPYIVAFDYREEGFFDFSYEIIGANIQTGDNFTIRENDTWAYPNYSVDDDLMIFDFPFDNSTILAKIGLNANKISAIANTTEALFPNGTVFEKWGVWFATGERELVSAEEIDLADWNGKIYPNPFSQNLTLSLESEKAETIQIKVFDLLGKSVFETTQDLNIGENTTELSLGHLISGTYFVRLYTEKGNATFKVMKR